MKPFFKALAGPDVAVSSRSYEMGIFCVFVAFSPAGSVRFERMENATLHYVLQLAWSLLVWKWEDRMPPQTAHL
ncbi:hypothetical protein, conserved [Eimeria necatrix]|uniref:Uncharacterized protein n=1 Tax=Eimeria necatrix TaxID=51315 RepID=U6MTT6_9EIME|nr:hypothetical protein, conserved [Eimeria necatrix]CDJ65884.1 hypothetical protein, conserved [Eimeria necatrix]